MKNTSNNFQVNIHLDGNYRLTGRQLLALVKKARPVLFSTLFYLLSMVWVSPREMGKSDNAQPLRPVISAQAAPTPAPPRVVKRKHQRLVTSAPQCPAPSRKKLTFQSGGT